MKPKFAVDNGLVELRGVWIRPQDREIVKEWIPTPSLCDTHRRILEEEKTAKLDKEQESG